MNVTPSGQPQTTNPMRRQKPQIPSLGPNLGKLGFTDLKPDSNDERKEDEPMNQQQQVPTIAAPPVKKPMMGLGLNLAGVKRDIDEQ